jgi:hypothetical protein
MQIGDDCAQDRLVKRPWPKGAARHEPRSMM